MPHFFPYEQSDLAAFCTEVARRVSTPVLLYNLPNFTTGLAAETAIPLMDSVPNIAGVKDSSGSLELLTRMKRGCRIVGDDGVLAEALRQNVCDAVISGTAGVLPDLILRIWENRAATGTPGSRRDAALLGEFCEKLATLPVPWGLKWIAEARGVAPARFSQPVSDRRRAQGESLMRWFAEWDWRP
jgi:4-hydroxy-tetrahydrodipicolinate synthase